MKTEIKKLEHSEIEITGEIPADIFDKNRSQAIKNLGKDIELSGFRKGHVPENVLVKHLGEASILEEMAEITIGKEYKNIIIENKLDPIGRPEVSITKMAMGNPLEFKIIVAVMPSIVLGDYKKIARKVYSENESISVTDKEIEETINEIRKMHAQTEASKTPNTEKGKDVEKDPKKKSEPKLPKLDDGFVKKLGNFKNVDDLKKKLKENIQFEKEKKVADKKRLETMDAIIKEAKIDLPKVILKAEQNKMMAQFKTDIERAGITMENYLNQIKKTEEEIQKDFEKEAEKRANIQLILNKIGIKEKITAPKKAVDEQVEMLIKQYPDADKEKIKIYVESTLVNQKVFEFLEEQK